MNWHDGERATVVGGIIIAVLFLLFYVLIITVSWDFSTLRGPTGVPVAADFANYWAASKLALSGKAQLAYNFNDLQEVVQQFFGTTHYYGCGWYYPPFALFIVLPLGLMPYLTSYIVWVTLGLILYMIVLSHINSHPIIPILCLLFPGILTNLVFGQNGFISGMLLGAGLLLLDCWPLLAGCLFGILCYKPPLAILILVALLAGRYWKAFIALISMALFLSILSSVVFGYQVWIEYFKVMSIPMRLLENGAAAWNIMPTFFAAALSAGFGVSTAYLAQGIVMLVVLAAIIWSWRQQVPLAIRGTVLVLGTLLFTPYVFVYDLAILALPLCWLWEEGRLKGRLPGELILLLMGWLMPIAAPILWQPINFLEGKLQIGPVILLALFILALVRAKNAVSPKTLQPQ